MASNGRMKMLAAMAVFLLAVGAVRAQDARALISSAVKTELAADKDDHTAYSYLDHDVTPEHDTLMYVVETPQGLVKRKLEDHGHKLTPAERKADDAKIEQLLKDADAQAKQNRDETHDDDQAEKMLKLLPHAFVWTLAAATAETYTLNFKPDPAYEPGDMESRVFAVMAGQVVIARPSNRLVSMRGKLTSDVKIALGLFGKLQQGGTFHVERREVVPGHWQIVDTNVHITGHVFFKTIGSQEDEKKTGFKVATAKTLEQAYAQMARYPLL